MRAMTQGWLAGVASCAFAFAAGCADEPQPTRVSEAELPSALTLSLEYSSLEGASGSVLQTLRAGLLSPDDIPRSGLRWPRLEPTGDAPWPDGWRVLPSEPPFGGPTGGIRAAERLSWPIEIVRLAPRSPRSAELRLVLEYTATAGGTATTATSAPIQVEFSADAAPHPVGEQDVRRISSGDIFLRVIEAGYDMPSSRIEVRPGGAYRAKPSSSDPEVATGVLSAEQRHRLHTALVESRIWELLGRANDPGPEGDETYISIILILGDAASVLQVRRSTLDGFVGWPALGKTLAELTGIEIPAR